MSAQSEEARRIERKAVNATASFFEDLGIRFQEIDLRNDIGKDANLDLAANGPDAGICIALQIKGGRKYKRKSGHAIPVDQRLRNVWSNGSLPIFLIVQDPDDEQLYWGNIADMLERSDVQARTIAVYPDLPLDKDHGISNFIESVRLECKKRRADPVLNLLSVDTELVRSALIDCLIVGRSDERYLRCVRALIRDFIDQISFYRAIHLLAHATSHPDILWSRNNYIPENVSKKIRGSFRWTPTEISFLVSRLPEEGLWSRGTIGQSLYMLLAADPNLDWVLDRVLLEAFRSDELTWRSSWIKGEPFGPLWVQSDREAVIFPVLTLILYRSNEPRGLLSQLTERMPRLQGISMFNELKSLIDDFGHIDIF